jgi:flagellar P-ring protein precursor FlgI
MRMDVRGPGFRVIVAAVFALLCAGAARAIAVQDMITLGGTGENTLWGLGFVVGLQGTGDSSDSLPLARQLAGLLEKGGNPVPDLIELTGGKNIAMVMVTCTLPREGARKGEKYDVHVQAWHNAKSLKGGRLFITPLQGPIAGQGVFAFAEGPIVIEGDVSTSAVVRRGAQVTWDFRMNVIDSGGMLTLNVKPEYAGWTTSKLLANTINQDRQGLREDVEEIARAMDSKSVRVRIPRPELSNPANFIGNILSIQLDPSLLNLPARVIVNERTGSIVVTGDVEISPTVISHKDLVVTTITPPPVATPENPIVSQSDTTAVDTVRDERSAARLEDLLEAMKALDVPVEDRIAILAQMHAIGHLHAEFVVE